VVKHFRKIQAVLSLVLILLISQNYVLAQDAGTDKTIVCVNTTMEASGVGTWTSVPAGATILPGDINNPLAPMTIAGGYGTYTFEWTSGGTPYTVDITYSEVTIISATLSANCSSASLVGFNPGGTFTGQWTASAGGVTFSDNTATTTTASNLPVGAAVTFYWEVTKEACPQQSAGSILTNTTPVGVDAGGPAIEVCTNSTQGLSGSALVGPQTGAWTFQTGSGIFDDSTSPSATVSTLVDGVNILRWTVTEGSCSAYDDVILTNNSVTATASNQNVCATNAYLDGNQPVGTSGVWTENPAGPANIVTPTDPGTEVTSLQVGANNFRWTLTKGGCNDIVDVTITRAILTADPGTDVNNLCATSTVLNATPAVPPATGVWSLIAGSGTFSDASLATSAVSGLDASTPNIFRWTVSSAGCTSVSDEVTITSNALPVDAGTDQSGVCGTSITLNAASGDPSGSGGSGVWTTASSANVLTPSNFTSTVTNLPPATSTYRWTVTKNGCSVWDEVQVTRSTYAANAGNDQTICGTSAVLSASDPGPGGAGVWTITSGAGTITNPASRNTTITNISSFPVVARWTLTAGTCSGEFDEVTISNQGTTVAEINGAPSLDANCGDDFYNGLLSVNAPIGGETLTWYEAAPASGVLFSALNAQTTNVTNLGLNASRTIVLEITDGVCTNLDTVVVNTYDFDLGLFPSGANFAGPDQNNLCSQYVTLDADALPSGYTGVWSSAGAGSTNVWYADNTDPKTEIKTYWDGNWQTRTNYYNFPLQFTVSNGSCSRTDFVNIENAWVATASVQGYDPHMRDLYICGSDIIDLEAYPTSAQNQNGGWYLTDAFGGALDFSGSNSPIGCGPAVYQERITDYNSQVNITGATGDFFILWVQCNNQCPGGYNYDTLYIHVGVDLTDAASVNAENPTNPYYNGGAVQLPFAGPNQNICGDIATLAAADPNADGIPHTSGQWSVISGAGNFSSISDPSATVSGLSAGANTFRWTVTNNCLTSTIFDDVTINVSAITGIDAGTDQTICEDYATFDADPIPPLGTGTWSVKSGGGVITDPTSNISTVTSLLQGRNVFLWTVNSPFCNAVDSVVLYSGRPDQPDAGPDQTFCGSGNMQAVPPPTGTAEWSVISGGATITTLDDPNTNVTPLVSPTTLRWTVTEVAPNGLNCTNYDDVIVIDNTPTTAFAGADQVGVCGSTGLAANTPAAGESGLWQTVAGTGTFADDTQAVTTVTGMQLGLNTYRWTITKGSCTSSDEVDITSDAIVANITTPDQSTCNTSMPLVAVDPAPATGLWTPMGTPATLTSTTAFATTANGLQNGVNTFEWRVTYGACVTTDFVTITNYTITPANAGTDQAVCIGNATLSSNLPNTGLGETGTWSNPFAIPGVTFADPTSSTTSVSGLQNGGNTLRWTISNGSCSDFDDVIVNVNTYTIEAGNPQAICLDNTTLQGSNPGAGTGVWSLQSGSGAFTTPNSSLTNVTGITSTTNVYRWTVTQGTCIYTDDVTVTLNTPTAANAGLDQVACGPTATLDADPVTVGFGTWTSSSGGVVIADPTYHQSGVSNLPGGATTFTWTVTNGTCTDVDQVTIYNNSFSIGGVSPPPICVDTIELQGTDPAPGTGVWTLRSGLGTFDDATYYRSIVRGIGRGDNVYRWTVSNGGCFDFVDITVTNLSVTANAGTDQTVCVDQVTLDGNDPTTENITTPPTPANGYWSVTPVVPPIVFTANTAQYNAIASGLGPDLNTFTWTVTNGTCSDTDEVQVFNYMPTLPNAGLDTTYCGIYFPTQNYSDTIQLNANNTALRPGETGYWTQVAGTSTFVDPTTDPNARVAGLEFYAQLGGPDYWSLQNTVNTYRWNIEYNGCIIWDEVTITNAAPFPAEAGVDQDVCWYDVNLNATDLGNGAQLHWWEANPSTNINFYDPIDGSTVTGTQNMPFNSYVDSLQIGTTTFRWLKENTINGVTCRIWDEMDVTRVNSNIGTTTAGTNQIVCSREAQLFASSPGEAFTAPPVYNVTGEWTVISGQGNFADANSYSTMVTDLGYQTNILRWTLTNHDLGCDASNDVYITNALPSDANVGGPDPVYRCTNTVTLAAERPTRGTGYWTVLGGGGSIANNSCIVAICNVYVTNLGQGTNSILWTTSHTFTDPATSIDSTCTLTDTVTVINNSIQANAGSDLTVCNDTAYLNSNLPVGANGSWSVTGGGGTIDIPSSVNAMVTALSPDLNTLTWTLDNGFCSNSDDINIINNNPEDPAAGPDQALCTNTTTLAANNPITGMGTGEWSVYIGSGVFTNSLGATTIVNNIPVGTNTYRWTITKGTCVEFDDVVIDNNSVIADAGSDIDNICGIEPRISDPLNLNATPPNTSLGQTGFWSVASSFGSIVTPTLNTSSVTGMDDGENIFRWTLSNGLCTDNDLVSVFVYIPTTASTNADFEACADPLADTEVLTANAPDPGRGTGTWSIVSGGGNILTPSSNISNVTNLGYNENRFRWTINHNGCTSSDDIIITNNFVDPDAGPDAAICTDTYTLQGSSPNVNDVVGLTQASGQWTVVQGLGIFADPTLYNTSVSGLSTAVANIFRWTVTKGGCSDYDDVSISNNEFTIAAGPDQVVCNSSATLSGQQPGAGESGVWSNIAGGGAFVDQTLYNTVVTNLPSGSNVFRWTVSNGTCSATNDVEIYFNSVTANAGIQQRVCATTVTLDGNNPSGMATGNWVALLGGASVTTPTLYNSGVTNLGPGQNTFQWTVLNTYNTVTCNAVSTVNIFNDTPDPAVVEADNEVCTNSTDLSVITTPTIGTGVWTAIDNLAVFDNSLSFNPTVTGLNRGINTFRWTVTNQACTSTDDVIITNNTVVSNAGLDKSTACADFTTLAGNNPVLTQGSGVWVDLSGTTATIVDNTLYNTSITGLEQGVTEFQWTVSLGSCSVSDNVQITNNQITATAGVDQVTCNTFYTPLDGNDVSGVGGTGVWTSVGNTADVTNPTLFNTGVTNLDPGLNTFRWTVTSGAESCTDFDEVGITNNGVVSNAGSDIETCNTSINLSAVAPTIGSGAWTQASGALATIVDPTNRQALITGLTGGVYAFTWTVVNGACSASDDVVVTNSSPVVSNPTTPTPESCDGTGVLQANAAGVGETGLWSGGAGSAIADVSANNTTVSGMPLGVNTYIWILSKGTNVTCTSANSVNITNNQVVANAGSDNTTSCNDFVTLSGNNPTLTQGVGLWTDQSGSTATIVNNTLYNTVVNNVEIGTTTFRWTVSMGTCSVNDDVIITNNQIVANAGTDQSTCDNFYNPLDGNDVSILGGTGVWSTTGTGTFVDATQFNTRVDNLQSGINTLIWTVTSAAEGCTDFDDVIITYNGVTADAGTNIETCNSNINLSANAPVIGAGSWTQTGGAPATIVTSTDRQSAVTGLTGGVYSFTWTVVNGVCSASDVVNVTNSSPTVSNPTTPTPESCDGTGVIQANVAGLGETGIWSGGAGSLIADVSANNTTVSGMPIGVNTYTWTLTKGANVTCASANSVSITNNQVVANAGSDNTTSCNDFVTLSGNNPNLTQGSGIWTDQTGTTATFVNNTLYNTVVNNVQIGTTTFRWTVSLGTCSADDDVVIANNQIVADAGTDQSTCSGTFTPLDGNDVSGVGGTGVWSTTGTGIFVDDTQYNTQIDNLQSGLNTLTWTVTSGAEGCTDSDDVIITNNGVTADAGADIETCDATINLSAIAATVGAGSWTQTGGAPATIVNSTDRQSSITGLTGGVYSFTWTVINGVCSASDVVNVTNSSPSVSNPTTPTPESCDGTGTIQANAPGLGETGLWSGGGGSVIADISANNTTVSGMSRGINTFIWTLSKGTNVTCTSANSVNIINNQVVAGAGLDKTTSCNDFVTLSGNNPLLTQGNGLWTDQSGSTATIVNNTLYNTVVNNVEIGTTTFRWIVSLGTCSASDDVIITNNQIVADAGTDQATCNGIFDPLDGNDVSGVGGTGVWSTTGTGTFVDATLYNTRVENLQTGLNTLTWTVTASAEGCNDSDQVLISNNGVTADAGTDREICTSSFNLSAIAPILGTGSWTQTGGAPVTIVNSLDRQSQVTGLTGGIYAFTWTVVNGVCSHTDEVVITNSSPSASNPTTPTPEVCDGNGTLNANAPGAGERGEWTLTDATGSFGNATLNNTTISGLKSGTNTLTWTLYKGSSVECSSAADVSIVNNQVTANAFTSNNIACNGTTTITGNDPTLQSTPGYPATGTWTVSTGATISNTTYYDNVSVTNLAQGDNIFTWTVSKGSCSTPANVTVTNDQVFATTGGNIQICGENVTLNAVDPTPNTGQWTLEGGVDIGAINIVTPSLFNSNVTGVAKTAIFKWTVTGTNCSAEAFVTVNNNSIDVNNGALQTVCAYDGAGSLNAGSLEAGQTGLWTSAGTNPVIATPSNEVTAVSNLDYGNNIFFWNVSNATGCSGQGRYEIVNDAPTPPNAGVDQDRCATTATLSGNTPLYGTGLWTREGGSTFIVIDDPTNSSTTVSGLGQGASTFRWTITNNACSRYDEVTINNNLFDVQVGNDFAICNNSANLSVVVGAPGVWTRTSGSGIIANSIDPSTAVSNLSFGENKFLWTVDDGNCIVTDEMSITVNTPEIPVTEVDKTVCDYNNVPISANAPTYGTGMWVPQGGTATVADPSSNVTTVSNLINGPNTIRWVLSYNGCDLYDDLVITSNAVTADAGSNQILCADNTALSAAPPGIGTGSWSVTSGAAVITNSLDRESTISNLAQGANILRWTVNNVGCSDFDEVVITNDLPDQPAAGTDINTCASTVNLTGNNPAVGTGVWSTLSGTATILEPTLYNTAVTVTSGVTTFTWTITNNGCTLSDDVQVSNESFSVSVNPDDVTCDGTFVLLGTNPVDVGTGTGTGEWSVISGSGIFDNSLAYNTTVRNLLATGTRESIFRWTITDGLCSDSDEVIIVNDEVTASVTGFMTCNSTQSILGNDPGAGNTGLWTVDNQTTQIIANPTYYNTSVSGLVPNAINRIRWTVSRNSCSATDTMRLEYFVPNATITIPDIVHGCADTVVLIADPNIGTGSGVWTESTGSTSIIIDNNTLANTTARNLEIRDNLFIWTVTDRGCTSSDQVSINNSLPINTAGTDQDGCTNRFTMNAEEPTLTGNGLWNLVSGTVSFDDQTLFDTEVTAAPGTNIIEWTITDNGCSASKRFNVINNLTAPDAGIDVDVCENRVQLSGSATKLGETGLWSIDGGITTELFSNASINNPEVTNLRQGIITFVWTVTNGICTSEDRVVVTNNTPLVDAGPDRTLCEDFVTLNGNNPAVDGSTGEWSIGSVTVSISNPTFYAANVTNLSQGSNLFTWTIDNGICTATDDVIITSNSIDVTAGIPYTEDCADTLYLEATAPPVGYTGAWTVAEGSGVFDNTASNITVARNLTGFNKLRWTITDGLGTCSFYDEIEFLSLLPTLANTQIDKAVCTDSTTITANPPATGLGESGHWTVVTGSPAVTIVTPTLYQTKVSNLDPGTNIFRWTISNASCNTSDIITITNNKVVADAGQDRVICDSSWSISANVTAGTGFWTSDPATPSVVVNNSTSPNSTVDGLVYGDNNFTWTVNYNGCIDSDVVTIRSNLPRNVSAGSDQNICQNFTSLTATNPGDGSGLWTVTGGAGAFVEATANQTDVTGLSLGENRFTWTVTIGACTESSQVIVNNNSINVSAGIDQVICNQDTLVLNGTAPGAGQNGYWTAIGGSGTYFDNSTANSTIVRGIAQGTTTLTWTLEDPPSPTACSNSHSITVINNTPSPALADIDKDICGDNTTISAQDITIGTGLWSVKSGAGAFDDAASRNTTVRNINVGINTYTWTVTYQGCSREDDIIVNNNSVVAYIADNDVSACTPTHTVTVIGNAVGAGETGEWTKNDIANTCIIVNTANNITNVTDLPNGQTELIWTVTNGLCTNSDNVVITNKYHRHNTAAAATLPNPLCQDFVDVYGDPIPVDGTGAWSSTSPDVTFDNPNIAATIVRDLPGGTSSVTWTITKDGCESPSSFSVVNSSIYTSAGGDQVICATTTNLNAQGLLPGETGSWAVDNGIVVISNSTNPATLVDDLITGDNTFTWTLDNGTCTATDQVVISNNTFNVDAGVDQIVCGTSFTLRGSDPLSGTGLWTVASGTGRFADPTNFETLVEDMGNGPNTFTWTVNRNGCEASADVTITNNLYVAVAGDDRAICSNQTTVSAQPLNSSWGATGEWTSMTGGGVFANPTLESTLVTGLSGGDNRLRWTVRKTENFVTCTSYDEIIITNNSITASAGTDETTCFDFATLSATPLSPTGTGLWTGGGAGLVTIANPTSATTLVSNLQQGVNTFAWTVNDNGCTGTSTVRITSNFFIAEAGNDQNISVNSTNLEASYPDPSATGSWTIVSGNGVFANAASESTLVTNLGFGVNTFRWTVDWNSCIAYDDVNIIYNNVTAEAGIDQVICSDRTFLNASNPAPATGVWTITSGGGNLVDPLNRSTEVTNILPGSVNIYRWTVTINGYSEFDEVIVTNGEFEITAGLDRATCGEDVTLAAEPAGSNGTGVWTIVAGAGTFSNISLENAVVNNLASGPNVFRWTVTKSTGCVDSDLVTVTYNLPPTAFFETSATEGCSPLTVEYTNSSTGGSSYYWNFGESDTIHTALEIFSKEYVAYNTDSVYTTTLVAFSDAGCSDTMVQQITAFGIPNINFVAYPPSQIYPDATINIENYSDDGYSIYEWNFGDGQSRLDYQMETGFPHTYDTWGTYTVTLAVNSTSSCNDTVRQTILILPPVPKDRGGRPYTSCEPWSGTISANVDYAAGYYWEFFDINKTPEGTSDEENPIRIFEDAGTYFAYLSVIDFNGDTIKNIRIDTIVVYPNPVVDFNFQPDSVMLPNQAVHFYNQTLYGDFYEWDFGDGSPVTDEANPLHYYTEEGIYRITLRAYTENECFGTVTKDQPVVVEPPGLCRFPNAFTPSLEGKDGWREKNDVSNDIFLPVYRGVDEYKLEIFNRWGEKIFESNHPDFGWNGYVNGKLSPQDVYVWKVTGKYKNGVIFKDAGDCTLLR
jgi:hypothetical protein